jgi:hypothetical protein
MRIVLCVIFANPNLEIILLSQGNENNLHNRPSFAYQFQLLDMRKFIVKVAI